MVSFFLQFWENMSFSIKTENRGSVTGISLFAFFGVSRLFGPCQVGEQGSGWFFFPGGWEGVECYKGSTVCRNPIRYCCRRLKPPGGCKTCAVRGEILNGGGLEVARGSCPTEGVTP